MKTIKLTIFCTFLIGNCLFAQIKSIEVEYTFKTRSQNGETVTFFKTLKDNGEKSIFINKDSTTPQGYGKLVVIRQDQKKNFGLIYDKKQNIAYYYSPIFSKDFWVKEDSLSNLFTWNFDSSTNKEILDFQCKSARCYFRGRNYIAYYTEAIPFYSGPWKFSSLPGLILEIATDDNSFQYEAYKFTGRNEKIEITNPYDKQQLEFISFIDYKKKYLKKLLDSQNSAKSKDKDEDAEYTFKDGSMELLK